MSPRLKAVLARVSLIGGVAAVVAVVGRAAPQDQTIAIRLGSADVARIDAVVTRVGESEPTAGFSQDFPGTTPRTVRHTFKAPNDTYIVVITLRSKPSSSNENATNVTGDTSPIPSETSFERQVSLAGGEVIVSPE